MTEEQKIHTETMIESLKPKSNASEYKVSSNYGEIIDSTVDDDGVKRSLWIYDDTEVESSASKLKHLQDVQLVTGRHDGVSMCILNHLTNNGQSTKLQISESHVFVVFKPLNKYVKYFLEKYMDFDQQQIKAVGQLLASSRYVTVIPSLRVLFSQSLMVKY
jgi:hypothetical protein